MRKVFIPGVVIIAASVLAGVMWWLHGAPWKGTQASRAPYPGCVWKPFENDQLGIRMLVEDCSDPSLHYVFSVVGNRIEQHRPADDVTYNGPYVLEVFTKPADQPIEDAIRAQFISSLSPLEQKECVVQLTDNSNPNGEGTSQPTIERYAIEPNAARVARISKAAGEDIPDLGCGPYSSAVEGIRYFEYQPQNSKTKFMFVEVGEDEPLFDENTIKLF